MAQALQGNACRAWGLGLGRIHACFKLPKNDIDLKKSSLQHFRNSLFVPQNIFHTQLIEMMQSAVSVGDGCPPRRSFLC
jgi:hypothetical protein